MTLYVFCSSDCTISLSIDSVHDPLHVIFFIDISSCKFAPFQSYSAEFSVAKLPEPLLRLRALFRGIFGEYFGVNVFVLCQSSANS